MVIEYSKLRMEKNKKWIVVGGFIEKKNVCQKE
jgi:hypothetical protein